jgi:hypothetical protein
VIRSLVEAQLSVTEPGLNSVCLAPKVSFYHWIMKEGGKKEDTPVVQHTMPALGNPRGKWGHWKWLSGRKPGAATHRLF